MSDTNRKPVDHGEIKVTITLGPPKPYIPPILRTGVVELNLEHEVAVAKYLLWELRALVGLRCRGRNIEAGDTFKSDGASAVMFVQHREAEFTDKGRAEEEAKVISEARRLNLPQSVKDLAAWKS